MFIIYCNLQLFSYDQMVYILNEQGEQIYAQKTDIENVIPLICSLAKERNINQVRLIGQNVYLGAWAEEIKTAYTLNYGKNTLEVEII